MTKPKTLEQLRAEKERAEIQLAQEQHKLERLENRKKYLEQGVQAAISTETEKITQPSGAATPMNCVNPPLAGSRSSSAVILLPRFSPPQI